MCTKLCEARAFKKYRSWPKARIRRHENSHAHPGKKIAAGNHSADRHHVLLAGVVHDGDLADANCAYGKSQPANGHTGVLQREAGSGEFVRGPGRAGISRPKTSHVCRIEYVADHSFE